MNSPNHTSQPEQTELLQLELRVLEAERRVIPAVLNFFDARKGTPDDPRRKATRNALIWVFLSGHGVASSGLLTLALAIATVYLACQANTLIKDELHEIRLQNKLASDQLGEAQKQFALQRQAEAQRRRSEILTTLLARKDCGAEDIERCPFVSDGQSRVFALLELASRQSDLHDTTLSPTSAINPITTQGAHGIDLSGIEFPPHTTFSNLTIDGINMASSELSDSSISDTNLQHADLHSALLERVRMHGVNLSNADLRSVQIYGADINNVNLSDATMNELSFAPKYRRKRGAGLIFGIEFGNAQNRRSKLKRVDFSRSDLRGVDFTNTDITECTFTDAMLDGAIFDIHLPQEILAALSKAKTCPDGEYAYGDCSSKMHPQSWLKEHRQFEDTFWSLVEIGLQGEAPDIFDSRNLNVVVEVAPHFDARRPIPIRLYGRISPAQGEKIHRVIDSKIHLFGMIPNILEMRIHYRDGIIFLEKDFFGFLSSYGCLDNGKEGSGSISCSPDFAVCRVAWKDENTSNPICSWHKQNADRVEYNPTTGSEGFEIHNLGRDSVLRNLGFLPGDIIRNDPTGKLPIIRYQDLRRLADRTAASTWGTSKIQVIRNGRTLVRTILVKGRD